MDIHEYFGVLRRGWALVVLGLLIGIVGGFAANAIQPRTYAATSREILTNSEATGDLTQSLQASNLAEGRIASYVLVATSGLVLQPVIDELKLDMTVQELAGHLSVVAPQNTLIVEITATAASPELAKSIANSVSSVFSDVVENQIENAVSPTVGATTTDGSGGDTTTATAPVRIVNIEHASLPTGPTSSNSALLLAVGGILGLALGLVGASLRESLDRRIRGRKDVAAVTDRPVLGHIRGDRAVRSSAMVMHTIAQSAIAESFRGLRASVEHVRSRDGVTTFIVTAMEPRQGASLVAANLALAIADTATTVVVVDANLQAPHQAEMFDLAAGPGLTDLLTTAVGLDDVLAEGPDDSIRVIPIGSRRARSADLLATARMRALVAELEKRFDVVIIDTAAISTATDAAVLGSYGTATLLVVAEGTATRPRLADALAALSAGGSIPAGIVLNQVPRNTRARRRPTAAAVPAAARAVPAAATGELPHIGLSEPKAALREATHVSPAPDRAVDVPPTAQPARPAPAPAPAPAPVQPEPESEPEVVPAAEAPVAPVEENVLDIPPIAIVPPVIETTSSRAAARAARVAAKAAARAAASRPQQPVSRFAPKPPAAVDALEAAAAEERKAWAAPLIKSVPVLEPVDESSNPVIDIPRGDTGERVTLLSPQTGDPTPQELAEIVANQFKDDVVYEIPVEAFGSFHQIDADAFAAVDNEPTILPPFRHTEPEVAPGTLVIDPVDPLNTGVLFTVQQAPVPLTEENAAFVIDLLADEPIYDQPRFEDWALGGQSIVPSEPLPDDADAEHTEPEFDASVYELSQPPAAVYAVPMVDDVAPVAVYEIPVVEDVEPEPEPEPEVETETEMPAVAPFVFDAVEPWPSVPADELPEEKTVPRPFVAPEYWPAPRLVQNVEVVQPAAAAAPAAASAPAVEVTAAEPEAPLARVTALPSRERLARESYMLKSRELERAAQERLRYEQERLEARIREQLEADRRQLAGKLDELLEDTVMIPRKVGDGS